MWLNGPDARRFHIADATGLGVIEMREVAGGKMLRAVTSESSYSLHVDP